MHIRSVDPELARTFAMNAGARGMTQAQYLRALVRFQETLTELLRKNVETRYALKKALADLGLEPVTR